MKTYFESIVLKRAIILLLILAINFYANGQEMKEENSVSVNIHDSTVEWGNCPDIIPEGCNVAILHGDPSRDNTDAVFKFQPDTDIPEHWHNSAERMILIQGEMTVTYEGEDTQTIKEGYFIYGPAKKPHTAKCIGPEPCLLYVGFIKPVDAFAGKAK